MSLIVKEHGYCQSKQMTERSAASMQPADHLRYGNLERFLVSASVLGRRLSQDMASDAV